MDAQARLFGRGDALGNFIKDRVVGEHTELLMDAMGDPCSGSQSPADLSSQSVHKRLRTSDVDRESCLSPKCFDELASKDGEIRRLRQEVEQLKQKVADKDVIIAKYKKKEAEDEKKKTCLSLQSMLKKVLEKFYKGRHCDSKMYPSDSSVTQSLLYLVKKFSDDPVNAVKYIQNDEIRYKFWYRSKRNRLSRLVREGYIQQLNRLSLEDMQDPKWHWDLEKKNPFNHPGVLAGARQAFHGTDSKENTFTMSQICFATAVIDLKVKGMSCSDKSNIDKIKQLMEEYQEEMVRLTEDVEPGRTVIREKAKIIMGILEVVEGEQTVLDSIRMDPKFWSVVDDE